MAFHKSSSSIDIDGHGKTSKMSKRVLLGYPQLVLLAVLCFVLGCVLPADFRAVRAASEIPDVALEAGSVILTDRVDQQLRSQSGASSLKNDIRQPPSLQIAWLMSFPNSGTSYTSRLIRHISETRTASNYGNENKKAVGPSRPVFLDQPAGPFWLDPDMHPEYTLPTEYVLTKTHCRGRCEQCPPTKYVESTSSFRRGCLSGKGVVLVNGTETWDYGFTYPADKVAKAVHLIRDPFDNVVSRFNLERHSGRSATDYPATREGFRKFCSVLNEKFRTEHSGSHLHHTDILHLMADVPCYADFFRYAEWHNQAFVTANDLNLETFVLHYDWYANRFNQTVNQLMSFLHLKAKADPVPFVEGKVYRDYYTKEEQAAVKQALEALTLQVTWENIARYFE